MKVIMMIIVHNSLNWARTKRMRLFTKKLQQIHAMVLTNIEKVYK